MPLTVDAQAAKRSRAWAVVFPAGLLLLLFAVAAVAPIFAWRGTVGSFHWYTQVTPHSRTAQGLTGLRSRFARGWVLRLGDWHWFVGRDGA